MEPVSWWTLVRKWFGRLLPLAARQIGPGDWFEQLFSLERADDELQPRDEPVVPPAAVDSLCHQLKALTPWNVRIDVASRPQGTAVRCRRWLSAGGSAQGMGAALGDEAPIPHLLNVLYGVQGFMVERTGRAWPARARLSKREREDIRASLRRLPLPNGVVENGEARLWFGDREHPELELDPISLR
jgi:hypothetical protein